MKEYVEEIALTGGSRKLIGGQVLDLEGEGKKLEQERPRQNSRGEDRSTSDQPPRVLVR